MRLEFALRPAENCARKGGITDFPGKEGNHGGEPARREICTVPCRGGLYIRPRALSTTQPGTGAYAMRPYRCAAMSRPHRVCTLSTQSTTHMKLSYYIYIYFIYLYICIVLMYSEWPQSLGNTGFFRVQGRRILPYSRCIRYSRCHRAFAWAGGAYGAASRLLCAAPWESPSDPAPGQSD